MTTKQLRTRYAEVYELHGDTGWLVKDGKRGFIALDREGREVKG